MRRLFWLVLAPLGALSALVVSASALPVLAGMLTWGQALRMTLHQWLPWAPVSLLLFWFTLLYPIERNGWWRRAAAHLVVGGLAVVGCAWLGGKLMGPGLPPFGHLGRGPDRRPSPLEAPDTGRLGGPRSGPVGPPDPRGGGRPPLWLRVRFNVPVCLTVVSLCHAFVYFRRVQQRDRRTLELETQLGQARLQSLNMQLHPHFLFNTLNAISTLVETNPDGAREMIGSLGQMLRLSLDRGSKAEIPLREEMKLFDSYLEIEEVRFGDRLRVSREIAADALDALVPTFLLQPLVENAIRHGIEPSSSPGRIEITARRAGGSLLLSIRDTGVGLPDYIGADAIARNGIGIANTKARLKSLYPGGHRFSVGNAPGGGCIAELELPFHTASDPADLA